ncbi:Uncharacterised protein [Serratia fonticola]|uniref:hypothetical protein n=1 Tax=Serratia fonticola TaxID=47917 RepID=UPI00217A199B|nr:hypothetical protein [Serratia fonticola]CAI1184613.1 Uncharacterised protein [Serratia fonticola]
MAFLGKKLSIVNLKDKVESAKNKAVEAAGSFKDSAGSLSNVAMETGKDWGTKVIEVGGKATNNAKKMAEGTVDAVQNFDYETSKEKASDLVVRSAGKMTDYFKQTLEVDKTTMEVVQEIRSRLPTPVSTVDQIFDQCRDEALRRAVSVFMLGSILNNVDSHSVLKYDKLSVNWKEFRKNNENESLIGSTHKNYAEMKDAIKDEGMVVKNGYNRDEPLVKQKGNIDVEHVTSRKAIFSDVLLSIGLTNQELGDVMNDKRNLVYADKKTNCQKSDQDLWKWIDKFKDDYQPDDDKVVITLKRTGEKRILDKRDLKEAYERSKEVIYKARINAGVEVASTVVKSGASMALQQVVGLIVVETLDVFMDEIKNFKLMTEDGLVKDLQGKKERIYSRLNQRFEERQIWARARELGVEAGVSGALSVLPQIIISLFVKMPAFVYTIIRESTLSVVRSVRVLCCNEEGKLDSLKVIMFGTASAIAGVYVQRVITAAISGVPLLNRFNSQISSVLSGMIVMAIPLVAIYTFDQNKQKLMLRLKKASSNVLGNPPSTLTEG